MSENPLRRADEVRTASLLSSQSNDNGSRVRQGDLRGNGGPTRQWWTLEMKEEENVSKEALDTAALAQCFFGPGRRQTGAVFLTFGMPRNDGNGTQDGVDPHDQAQPPIGCIQADDTGTDVVEPHSPCQQWLCKGSIMGIGRQEQKEDGQARTVAEQRMHAIAQ